MKLDKSSIDDLNKLNNLNETNEKKTLNKNKKLKNEIIKYTEVIVYVLAIIVVIFSNIYGSIYIQILPLLIVLGIIGVIFFKRAVMTTLFGIAVSICIIYTNFQNTFIENIILSVGFGISIAIGEVLGIYFKKTYRCINNKDKDKIKKDKKIKTYAITTILVIIALFSHIYMSGDIFTYKEARKELTKYLDITYGVKSKELGIIGTKYSYIPNRKYIFKILDVKTNKTSEIIIYLNYKINTNSNNNSNASKNTTNIEDRYLKESLYSLDVSLNEKFLKYIEEVKKENDDLENNLNTLNISLKYIDFNNISIKVEKAVQNINEEKKEEFAKEVSLLIANLESFSEYDKTDEISITLNSEENKKDIITTTIFMEEYMDFILGNEDENNDNNYSNENKINKEGYKYILEALEINLF
jgi:hypothetical protein